MNIKIFVVFHKHINEFIFRYFDREEYLAIFSLYGVNEAHDKTINSFSSDLKDRHPNLVLEYELNWYAPELQKRGFMETSCYIHVLKNNLHGNADLVGICQYDMLWTPRASKLIRKLKSFPRQSNGSIYGISVGHIMGSDQKFNPLAFAELRNWDFLLESYNKFFNKNYHSSIFINQPLTLYQTYLMPRDDFEMMAKWLETLCAEVYPWASQPPYETHWGVLGGLTERAESIFVAIKLYEGRQFIDLPLDHDPNIVRGFGIKKEHYGQNS